MSRLAARNDPPGEPPDLLALPPGTRILEFEIERVVGRGGFSIVYLAFDHTLHRRVALKEYLPDTLARRDTTLTVVPFSAKHRETFDVGLRSFMQEARLLARFDHRSLVKVYRFWEASGTAYMAMSYYEGTTLRDTLRGEARPGAKVVEKLTARLLDAIELLHGGECLHRDIAPDNVILQRDGNPVLLDFGAARRIINEKTQALTVILKTGYAPIEQYSEEGEMAQGPWTDVYALAATLYAMITGKGPPASVSRAYHDPYVPLARLAPAGYSPAFLCGIDQALAFLPKDRPQTIAAFRRSLGLPVGSVVADAGETTVRLSAAAPAPTAPPDATIVLPRQPVRATRRRMRNVALAASTVVAVALASVYFGFGVLNRAPPAEPAIVARVAPPPPVARTDPQTAPNIGAPSPPPTAAPPPSPPAAAPQIPRERPQETRIPTAPPAEKPPAVAKEEAPPPKAELPARTTPAPSRAADDKPRAKSLIPVPASPTPPAVASLEPSKPATPAPSIPKPEPPSVPGGSAWEKGRAFETGQGGTAVDLAEAVSWYRRGADDGDARAQNSLGFAYQNGRGVGLDYAAARKWYEAAAAQGNPAAQNNLGNLHDAGLGVGKNEIAAVDWYRKSADQGYAIAQNNLGLMLEKGRGTFRDYAAAADLFRRAAESGNMNAMYNLGRLYESGNGVAKSRADALKWFQAAAEKGQRSAAAKLAELERR